MPYAEDVGGPAQALTPSKSTGNKEKNLRKNNILLASRRSLTKIAGSGSGSIIQRYGSAIRIRIKMSQICNTVFCFWRLRRPKQPQREVSDLLPLSPRAYTWGAGQYQGSLPGEAEICLCQGAEQRAATLRAQRWGHLTRFSSSSNRCDISAFFSLSGTGSTPFPSDPQWF